MQRLNLIARFNYLFVQCPSLKGVIIISTLFTLSVDIFYEFGPVYLTGLWSMMPASIAVYNAALSFTLAVGAGWLPHLLSQYFAIDRVIATAMLLTAAAFGIMAIYPTPAMAFVLFALSGLSISTANTNLTIQVSNAADKSIQGEAMGAQLGLRMLGDAAICLLGGFVIISSVIWPMILSCLIGLMAVMFYMKKW